VSVGIRARSDSKLEKSVLSKSEEKIVKKYIRIVALVPRARYRTGTNRTFFDVYDV
jgi:hypothetical protein